MHQRRFFYLDYESIKRYGLDHLNVDLSKTYEVFNPTNNNHTIHLYLNKDLGITCPRCNGTNIKNVGTKNIKIKYASALEDNIDIIWHVDNTYVTIVKNQLIFKSLLHLIHQILMYLFKRK